MLAPQLTKSTHQKRDSLYCLIIGPHLQLLSPWKFWAEFIQSINGHCTTWYNFLLGPLPAICQPQLSFRILDLEIKLFSFSIFLTLKTSHVSGLRKPWRV